MRFFKLFLLSLLLTSYQSKAQTTNNVLDSLYAEIEFLIGSSWYLSETENGFLVTFCRSCSENYITYLHETDSFSSELSRSDFFDDKSIDSIAYFSTVSIPNYSQWSDKQKTQHFTELFKPNGILQFEVIFTEKWSSEKVNFVQSNNNQLRDSILKEPLYKTSLNIFSDYRFWLPEEHLRKRTHGLNFYFERMPYESQILDNSIFILHNKPYFFSEPMLVDRQDPAYFYNEENQLAQEWRRTLKIIALVLGIHDYAILN